MAEIAGIGGSDDVIDGIDCLDDPIACEEAGGYDPSTGGGSGGGTGGGSTGGGFDCSGGTYCSNSNAVNFEEYPAENQCIDNGECMFYNPIIDELVPYDINAGGYCLDEAATNYGQVGVQGEVNPCIYEEDPDTTTDETYTGDVEGDEQQPTDEQPTTQNNICGCMDDTASNYNSDATTDEGSCGDCEYDTAWFDSPINKALVIGGVAVAGFLIFKKLK